MTVIVTKMHGMIRGWHNDLVLSNLTGTKYLNRVFFYELEIKIYFYENCMKSVNTCSGLLG